MRSRSQLAIRSARKMKKKVFLQCLWKKSFFGGLKGLCFFSGSKKKPSFFGDLKLGVFEGGSSLKKKHPVDQPVPQESNHLFSRHLIVHRPPDVLDDIALN